MTYLDFKNQYTQKAMQVTEEKTKALFNHIDYLVNNTNEKYLYEAIGTKIDCCNCPFYEEVCNSESLIECIATLKKNLE